MVRFGMVGGGPGAFIGDVHRKALFMDHESELVAGAFSRDYAKSLETGRALEISEERVYASYHDMAAAEGQREDGIEVVSIVTPNHLHFDIAKAFLEQGIHVVCDKPVTVTAAEAIELKRIAEERKLLFCVTYTYSGYPILSQAREMVADGRIGEIRVVQAEFPEGWLASRVEDEGDKQASWRNDPAQSGASNCTADLGSHVEHLVSFVTGLTIRSLCASMDTFVAGRQLDDNAAVMLRYSSGATGSYWVSYVAPGHDNGLRLRIYGSEGSLQWVQEDPDHLVYAPVTGAKQILSRGRFADYPDGVHAARIPAGHPEGFYVAFANIYRAFLADLRALKGGAAYETLPSRYPTIDDGIRGLKFVEACIRSSSDGGTWVELQE